MPDGSASAGVEAVRILEQLGGRAREIVLEARKILEEQGLEALSMRNLATRLGMRAPSLYKHFASKESLESLLISIGFEEQAALFEAALRSSRQPLLAMARAYRAYGRDHPGLYRLMYDRELNRKLLRRGSEERAVQPVVEAAGGDRDLARAAFAFAHGMTILELNARFPRDADLDAAWQRGVTALQSSIGQIRRRRAMPPPRRTARR
jgi:AcrR family transcriptional regulator